jgi:hypothetical protein
MTKEKWIQIILTALISAGIAFLQNLLASFGNTPILHSSPEVAGFIGAGISFARIASCA